MEPLTKPNKQQQSDQSTAISQQEGETKTTSFVVNISLSTLKKQTIFSYQQVSETLKNASLINTQTGEVIEGVETTYTKLQTIDSELQGQLQIIRMLVVQLENKKLDVQLLYDKVLILSKLSETEINSSLVKQSEESEMQEPLRQSQQQIKISQSESNQIENIQIHPADSNKDNEIKKADINNIGPVPEANTQKIQTLCDFVDEESIEEITHKAENSFNILKVIQTLFTIVNQGVKDKTIAMTENLIHKIEGQISSISKAKSDLDFQFQLVQTKNSKLLVMCTDIQKLFKSVEKVFKSLDNLNISQEQTNHIYNAIVLIQQQSDHLKEEINQEFEMLKTSSEKYDEFYENSRESYVNFVNFAPSVQQQMQEVDAWHQQYDMKRLQCLEDFEEIEKLSTWYEYFQKSYLEFEKELIRRRDFECEMQRNVHMMREYLRIELQQEQMKRLDFNDCHYRYLPGNIKSHLEDPPIRYEIYPKFIPQDTEGGLQREVEPERIMEFLEQWQSQIKNQSFYQQLGGGVTSNLHIPSDHSLMGGSVMHDDYIQKENKYQQPQIAQGGDDNEYEAFVSVEDEDYPKTNQ